MQAAFSAFLDALKGNKKWAVGAFLLFFLFSFTNQDSLAIWPESWQPTVKIVSQNLKWAILSFSLYAAGKNTFSAENLHEKLKEIQKNPNQKVLPPKELLDSNVVSTIKQIADDSKKV